MRTSGASVRKVPSDPLCVWLRIPGLDRATRRRLESDVLAGHELKRLPAHMLTGERKLLHELSLQIQGKPSAILESSARIRSMAPRGRRSRRAWSQRRYLRGFAFHRLGRYEEAIREWAELTRQAGPELALLRPRIELERAVLQMNRGEFRAAIAGFEVLRRGEARLLDFYSYTRLLGCEGLSRMHLGEFDAAARSFDAEETILRRQPSPPIERGLDRIRITLALKRDDFASARRLLEAALGGNPVGSTHAFLLQLKARLHGASGELAEAEATLERLRQLIQELNLPLGLLDLREDEASLAVRRREGTHALAITEDAAREARSRHDSFSLFRALMMRAQALVVSGRLDEALAAIEEATALGESKGYLADLTWCHFHAAGILSRLEARGPGSRHPLQLRLCLERGRVLASQLRLGARAGCFGYLLELHRGTHASASSVIGILSRPEIGPEIERFLNFYGALGAQTLLISDGASVERVSEGELRQRLWGATAIFWFNAEGVLVNPGAARARVVRLSDSAAMLAAFRLLMQAGAEGLRLRDLHQARSPHAYIEHRHAPAAKMLISRLRRELDPAGIGVEYDRELARYRLKSPSTIFRVRLEGGESLHGAVPARSAETREELIRARIELESFVTTAQLRDEFRVTRQTLHPTLQSLVRKGKVRLVKRGPISGYAPA